MFIKITHVNIFKCIEQNNKLWIIFNKYDTGVLNLVAYYVYINVSVVVFLIINYIKENIK